MNRFRMLPPTVDDLDTTIVRIEKSNMKKIGLRDGDTVKITGMRSSGAVCYAINDGFKMSNDSEITYLSNNPVILPSIRVGNFVGQNINRHGSGLIPLSVEKISDGTIPASKVCLMSLSSGSVNENFDKSKLDALIVCKNDRLRFQDPVKTNNFGFIITCVEPADYSQITNDTIIEFAEINPNIIHSSFNGTKLKKLQTVIPITYQETLNNVEVTIPSFEIYDTGIRFYLYVKSNFEQQPPFQNGPTSVVVTLEDDLGNLYELIRHGGGGSSSPNSFEYKHDFHCKPLHPDVKQITITLHEILIQESFPRENPRSHRQRMQMTGTKDEYASIDKFPSFFIISGPWKTTFSL